MMCHCRFGDSAYALGGDGGAKHLVFYGLRAALPFVVGVARPLKPLSTGMEVVVFA